MLKVIGSICVLMASIGGCMLCMTRLKEHERQLLEIKEVLVTLENQMEYVRLPLQDLLLELTKKTKEPFSKTIFEFLRYLEKNQTEDVSVLWKEILQEQKESYFLNREEFEILLDIGRLLEPMDSKSQIASIQLYKSRIDEKIQKMWEERGNKQKVYQSICLMGGLIVIIILL